MKKIKSVSYVFIFAGIVILFYLFTLSIIRDINKEKQYLYEEYWEDVPESCIEHHINCGSSLDCKAIYELNKLNKLNFELFEDNNTIVRKICKEQVLKRRLIE